MKINIPKDKKSFLIIDSDLKLPLNQRIPITTWDVNKAEIKEDDKYAELHFLIEDFKPLSLNQFILLEFKEVKYCLSVIKKIGYE